MYREDLLAALKVQFIHFEIKMGRSVGKKIEYTPVFARRTESING
jgi:hypothetical protein